MKQVLKKAEEEIRKIIPAIIYFLITFNLIYLTYGLTLPPKTVRYYSYLSVSIAALFVGKALLIIDTLPFINAFPEKPIAYNVAWKFIMYNFFILVLRLLELFLHGYYDHRNWHIAFHNLQTELISPFFWALEIWVAFVLFFYILFTEIIGKIGQEKFKHMLFG